MEVSGEIQAPATFSSGKEPAVLICIGGLVSSSIGLDAAEKKLLPLSGIQLRYFGRATSRHTDWAIPASKLIEKEAKVKLKN
jgi:hypothetical protein